MLSFRHIWIEEWLRDLLLALVIEVQRKNRQLEYKVLAQRSAWCKTNWLIIALKLHYFDAVHADCIWMKTINRFVILSTHENAENSSRITPSACSSRRLYSVTSFFSAPQQRPPTKGILRWYSHLWHNKPWCSPESRVSAAVI